MLTMTVGTKRPKKNIAYNGRRYGRVSAISDGKVAFCERPSNGCPSASAGELTLSGLKQLSLEQQQKSSGCRKGRVGLLRKPCPKARPQADGFLRFNGGGNRLCVKSRSLRFSFVISGFRPLVTEPFGFNARIRPPATLDDAISFDHIVRAAILVPIAHRGIERHGLAVERYPPVCRRERSHHAFPATAAARVHRGRVFHRDVQNAWFQFTWYVPDKPVLQGVVPHHNWSLFSSMPPSVV